MIVGDGTGGGRRGLQRLSSEEQPGCTIPGCTGESRESTGPLDLSLGKELRKEQGGYK